jgi:hypothetical protein
MSDKAIVFRDLAAYLRSEKIQSCVLHGIDPVSGEFGRDLDLYIPDSRQAYRVAIYFSELLRKQRVRWVSLMHPFWGPRCIGIQEGDLSYYELHVISKISTACIDYGELFPIRGTEGPHGFNFDPSLWFIKAVLQKFSSCFAHCDPVWARISKDTFVLAHKVEIEKEFQKRWKNGARLVSAILAPDTDASLRMRRRELYAMMSWHCLMHPRNAACGAFRWLYRKRSAGRCKSVPIFGIGTAMEASALRDLLIKRLGHVFVESAVTDHAIPGHVRRRLQAAQSLVVLQRDKRQRHAEYIDYWIPDFAANPEEIGVGVAAILDAVVQYNERWSALYRIRTSGSGKLNSTKSDR